MEILLKKKYTVGKKYKGTKAKPGGNSGGAGRKALAKARGHQGGQISAEEKAFRTEQGRQANEARSRWFHNDQAEKQE